MKLELTQNQIEFFKQKMGIDVTCVVINDTVIDRPNVLGMFSHYTEEISIDVQKIKNNYKHGFTAMINTTIVHELVHYCQLVCNKSLILPINSIFTGNILRNRFACSTFEDRPIEIDAVLMECYYLYSLNGDVGAVRQYIKLMCNSMKINTLLQYAIRLNDKGFLECLNKSLKVNIIKNGGF